jgi:hypothetical protein
MVENGSNFVSRASSTMEGLATAESHFFKFVQTLRLPRQFDASNCTKKFFDEFSGYVATLSAPRSREGTLAPKTVVQYLSGTFNILKDRFPNVDIFSENMIWNRQLAKMVPEWYSELRARLYAKLIKRIIENGKKLVQKSLSIEDNVAETVGHNLLLRNTLEDTCLSNVNTACALNGGR